jgi:hypothetical protein
MIFAGGDIAPVEPAAPASADFWGQIGFSYDANDVDGGMSFGDEENNAFSAAVVLGVEKELGYGFGFGAELAGWTDFGLEIADNARVASGDQTSAEISQAYLTYTFGNTAIKAGRQALPKAVSPWAWSDRSVGVVDFSYDGIVIANTDLQDTTLVAAWVDQANLNSDASNIDVSDSSGLFMLAMINKSLANTTLAVSAYYIPESNFNTQEDVWSVWASAVSNFDGITVGAQLAYVDGDVSGSDATVAVAGKIGSSWGDFSATLVASYINDGDYNLKTAGSGLGTSAFWGNAFGGFLTNGDIAGDTVTQVRVDMGYKLGNGKLFGGIGYVAFGDNAFNENGFGGRIGYQFKVMDVNAKVEYRYADYNGQNGNPDTTKQRIRVEAFYKF